MSYYPGVDHQSSHSEPMVAVLPIEAPVGLSSLNGESLLPDSEPVDWSAEASKEAALRTSDTNCGASIHGPGQYAKPARVLDAEATLQSPRQLFQGLAPGDRLSFIAC